MAASSSETSAANYQSTWKHLHQQDSESLKLICFIVKTKIIIPAKVEADCCKDCNMPLEQPNFLATTGKGISLTRSCNARAV